MLRKAVLLVALLSTHHANAASNVYFEDVRRFAQLFKSTPSLSAEQLQKSYIDTGSTGVEIFTPMRIKNGANMAKKIAEKPEVYKRAIDYCLPELEKHIPTIQQASLLVQQFLDYQDNAHTYFVIGADNSGGTANSEGLALGLEKNCQFITNNDEFADYFSYMVAHELVHVYQSRHGAPAPKKRTLLYQSLREGVPELIAQLTVNKLDKLARARTKFGLKNEEALKPVFFADMDKHAFGIWMYNSKVDSQPADMGYWIGMRIAKAYYQQANDKQKALQELIELSDPLEIAKQSGYFEMM